ncbi:hypothetical protein CFAM422_009817 [Trichoderma lentiforme]|uniref:Uncharacterized protein n=1 Tax=Trichoderma lentiforme TaxID=1567552 RepID=A0A9P5CB82_9HYPO|nr:hypothetical protein CFAM422_009817 [Trichoderma lentiforme]
MHKSPKNAIQTSLSRGVVPLAWTDEDAPRQAATPSPANASHLPAPSQAIYDLRSGPVISISNETPPKEGHRSSCTKTWGNAPFDQILWILRHTKTCGSSHAHMNAIEIRQITLRVPGNGDGGLSTSVRQSIRTVPC